MSSRIKELQRLFEVRRSVVGSVVKVDERGYHVATDKGVQVCNNLTATGFRAGDTVRIVEGGIVGGTIDESRLPTYQV